MSITFGDHLVDIGYHDITPEQERELEAREECARRGVDPDAVCADGGILAWMVVDQEMFNRNPTCPASAPDDLRELREAAEQATPGPWAKSGFTIDRVISADDNHHTICFTMAELSGPPFEQRVANATFIAAANPSTVLSLIARIARLESENARLRERLTPFAEGAKHVDQYYGDSTGWQEQMDDEEEVEMIVLGDALKVCTIGDLRAARAAVSETKP